MANFIDNNWMYVGNFKMNGLHDLSQFNEHKDVFDYLEENNIKPKKIGLRLLWNFYKGMKIDDIVIAYYERTIWGIGRIVGDYESVDNKHHARDVFWEELNPPIDIQNDMHLFGQHGGGILSKNKALYEIDIIDWSYILVTYPSIGQAFKNLYFIGGISLEFGN